MVEQQTVYKQKCIARGRVGVAKRKRSLEGELYFSHSTRSLIQFTCSHGVRHDLPIGFNCIWSSSSNYAEFSVNKNLLHLLGSRGNFIIFPFSPYELFSIFLPISMHFSYSTLCSKVSTIEDLIYNNKTIQLQFFSKNSRFLTAVPKPRWVRALGS